MCRDFFSGAHYVEEADFYSSARISLSGFLLYRASSLKRALLVHLEGTVVNCHHGKDKRDIVEPFTINNS